MRLNMPRSFYIPKGSIRIQDKKSDVEAWIYEVAGKPYALAFIGRAQKPAWHYSFRSIESRENEIRKTFEGRQARQKMMADIKTKRQAASRGLKTGDVLVSTWGYDQTNVDFYEVTKLIGKTMVEVRGIASKVTEVTAWAQGRVVPVPGEFISKVKRYVAKDGGIKVRSFAWARKMETEIEGVKTYRSVGYTEYA